MDKATKALSQRVSALEKIVHTLRDAPRQQSETGVSPHSTTGKEHNATGRQFSSGSQIHPSPSNPEQAKKPWYKTTQGWKTTLELVGIPFAIAYAVVTYLQWRDLGRHFAFEQRSWLSVPAKYNVIDFTLGGPITYPMGFVNTGKTPAVGVYAIVRSQVVAVRNEPDFAFPSGTANEYTLGELVPNVEEAPQQLQARESHAPIILSASQVERIKSGLDYFATYGEITYSDIAGPHWMRFCREVYRGPQEKGQNPHKCAEYNSSGDGKEPPKFN